MTNSSKRKGSAWELALVKYLNAHGFPNAERAYGAGRPDDRGDIDGLPLVVLEAKNCARLELAKWVDEAETERTHARKPYGFVLHKRRGRPVGQGYATCTIETLVQLLDELESNYR